MYRALFNFDHSGTACQKGELYLGVDGELLLSKGLVEKIEGQPTLEPVQTEQKQIADEPSPKEKKRKKKEAV